MIRLFNVKKGFNIGRANELIAVNDVSLSLKASRVTVLKGPSGSGKTTLLSLIGCMARPTSGRIMLDTEHLPANGFARSVTGPLLEVTSLPERFLTEIRRKTFGFIFQQFNLVKGLTLLENIMLPSYPLGEPHGVARKRALSLISQFGLEKRVSSKVEWLSGGEAQRVAIARALMNNPPVLIADEPTAHLDSKLSQEFMASISSLKEQGKTAIIASHDPLVYEAASVDHVVSVRDGLIEGEAA